VRKKRNIKQKQNWTWSKKQNWTWSKKQNWTWSKERNGIGNKKGIKWNKTSNKNRIKERNVNKE
jgi:hypothetical protein